MIARTFFVVVSLLFNINKSGISYPWEHGQWHKYEATMNHQHFDFASFFIDDLLFAIGGNDNRNMSEYVDTSSDNPYWISIQTNFDFESLSGGSSIVYSDDMVFLGCDEVYGQLRLFDFTNKSYPDDSSYNISSIPFPVTSCCMTLYSDKIYITGGQLLNNQNENKGQPLIQIYDIEYDKWTFGANMSIGRMFHGCEIIEETAEIYVFMGDTSDFDNETNTNEKYDIMSDNWMSIEDKLNNGRHGFYAKRIPYTNYIMLNGGYWWDPTVALNLNGYQNIVVFNIETNEFLEDKEANFPQLQCSQFERSVTIIQEYDDDYDDDMNITKKGRIWNIGGEWEYNIIPNGESIYYMDYPCDEFNDCINDQPICTLQEFWDKYGETIIICVVVGSVIICLCGIVICVWCMYAMKKATPTAQYEMFTDDKQY